MAKQFLDKAGVTTLWNKIKSMFVKKAKLGENANFNDVTEGGMYRYNSSITNGPDGAGSFGQLLVVRGADDTIAQLCFPYQDSRMFLRTGNAVGNSSGTWQGWVAIASTNDLNNYLKKQSEVSDSDDNYMGECSVRPSTYGGLNHMLLNLKGTDGGSECQIKVSDDNGPKLDIRYGYGSEPNGDFVRMATEEYVNSKVGSGGANIFVQEVTVKLQKNSYNTYFVIYTLTNTLITSVEIFRNLYRNNKILKVFYKTGVDALNDDSADCLLSYDTDEIVIDTPTYTYLLDNAYIRDFNFISAKWI